MLETENPIRPTEIVQEVAYELKLSTAKDTMVKFLCIPEEYKDEQGEILVKENPEISEIKAEVSIKDLGLELIDQ